MKKSLFLPFVFLFALPFSAVTQRLMVLSPEKLATPGKDWLLHPVSEKANLYQSADGKDLILYNGLIKRTFRISPNVACIDFQNLSKGQQLLRSVMPEGVLFIDNKEYRVGGLYGQKEKAYLKQEWVDDFNQSPAQLSFPGIIPD